MLILKTDSSLSNVNLPLFQSTANEKAVASLLPSTWLEGDDRYIQSTTGVFGAWIDRASGRRYIPGTVGTPQIIPFGLKKALRFGYMANNASSPINRNNNGALVSEGAWEALSLSGTFTFGFLMRLPKDKGVAGSELLASSDSTSGGSVFSDTRVSSFMCAYVDTTANGGLGFFEPGLNPFPFFGNFHDAVWHSVVISLNATDSTSVMRVDGSQVAANIQQPLTSLVNETGAKRLQIGGNTNGLSYFVGDMGALIYIPDVAVHSTAASLAALEGHLLTLKTAFTS